jgi:hypothetical protein
VIGTLLVISALLARLVAAPILTRLPSNLDLTLHYRGTATLLNAKALQTGDATRVLLKDVPATIDRHLTAVSSTAHTATVTDQTTLTAAGITSPQTHTYVLDRTTLRTVPAPGGTAVEPTAGCLAIAFPLHPKAGNSYTVYDTATQRCFPLTYVGHGSRGGRAAYEYEATMTGALSDKDLLQSLPPALPKQTLAAFVAQLPPGLRAQFAASLGVLPGIVPLAYRSATTLHVWADKETGLPLDETHQQQLVVGLNLGGQRVNVMPVLDVHAGFTPDSVKNTAATASSASTKLLLIQIVIPAALAGLGLVLLVLAILRRRPASAPQPAATVAADPVPAGTR